MDAKFTLLEHLIQNIGQGLLIPGKAKASDWFRLLAMEDLSLLRQNIQEYLDKDEDEQEVPADVLGVIVHLHFLEQDAKEVEMPVDEIFQCILRLSSMCHLEMLRRLGLIEIGDFSIQDVSCEIKITEKGERYKGLIHTAN